MTGRKAPLTPRWLLAAAGIVLVLLALQSARLGHQVLLRLEELSTAATDNMQWSLSQAEVEHLKLETAVLQAQQGGSLQSVRRQFNIYYSRVATLRESPQYEDLRQSPSGAAQLRRMQVRLDEMAALIDSGDGVLRARLAELAGGLARNGQDVREMALSGVALQADASAQKRLKLFTLLSRLAWVVLALFAALALTALMLGRLYRRGRQLAAESGKAAARMEAMIASSLDAVLVAGTDGRIQAFNGAAESIFGYTAAEAVGRKMTGLIVPEHLRETHDRRMAQLLSSGEAGRAAQGRVQIEALRKSGEVFPAELSLTVSRSGSDTVCVGFLRDISDRIAAEEELRRARDDALAGERAKANLLTVMSHEMRTPLTGILGAIELLETPQASAEQRRYLQAMRVSGELLLHHVNDVLELSRLEAAAGAEPLQVFDLGELVAGLVESQQASAQVQGNTLTQFCSLGTSTAVAGRPRAVQQALLNLIGNALKFTRGGAVSVDVLRRPGSETVEFLVADTGQGIPAEDIERIFEDFITLDASYGRGSEGTGLGLAITRRIVTSLGGAVSCESAPGEGSLFTISLPLPAARLPARTAAAAVAPDSGAKRLLIAEDNDINRVLLERMLGLLGHQVVTAPGGAEAVAAARDGSFDLILMDISMPGVDGIEALRRIREAGYADGTSIVALTAHAAPEDHARILQAGFAEVLTKPASKDALAALIARHAGGAEPEAAAGASDIRQFIDALGADRARSFLISFREDVARLQGDLAAAEALTEGQRKEAHRLAGSAAVLGLAEVRACMLSIEEANDSEPPPLQPLVHAWDQAEALLAPHLRA